MRFVIIFDLIKPLALFNEMLTIRTLELPCSGHYNEIFKIDMTLACDTTVQGDFTPQQNFISIKYQKIDAIIPYLFFCFSNRVRHKEEFTLNDSPPLFFVSFCFVFFRTGNEH